MQGVAKTALVVFLFFQLTACGGGGGSGALGQAPPAGLSYPSPQTYTVGSPIAPLNPTVTGAVTSYSAPPLPTGLAINAISGVITGTPTTASAAANFAVTATNAGGATSFNLSIAILVAVPPAPSATVSYGIKQVVLNWGATTGATFYRALKNPGGNSGYSQLGADLTSFSYADVVAVHLTDWINARYIVEACNSSGCAQSAPVSATDSARSVGYLKASNTGAGASLGHSLAISRDGMTLAVGASQEASAATGVNGNQADASAPNSGAAYIFTRVGNAWSQQAYIKASNTDANDLFGYTLALSGDGNTLAVVALDETSAATGINGNQVDNSMIGAGAVYVFVRSGSTWSQQAYVKASNTQELAGFGAGVALSNDGNTLAVGAFGEASSATGINGNQADKSAEDAGAVYIFTRASSSWAQQAYIKASNTQFGYNFGWSVALSSDGNTLAVGSSGESSASTGINGNQINNAAFAAGAVYVFTRTANSWTQQTYIKASNTDSGDSFGGVVSLSGDGTTLAVTAIAEASAATGVNGNQTDNSARNAGAVYTFKFNGTWAQQAYIKASNTASGNWFGMAQSLSFDGNTLAVGSYPEASPAVGINGDQLNTSAAFAGAVYVFTLSTNGWAQRSYVKASNTEAGDSFGFAVALNGDGTTLAASATAEGGASTGLGGDQTSNTAPFSGAAYVY